MTVFIGTEIEKLSVGSLTVTGAMMPAFEAFALKSTMAAARKRLYQIARLSLVFMRAAVARSTLFIEKVPPRVKAFQKGQSG